MSTFTKKIAATCFTLALLCLLCSAAPVAQAGDACYEPTCVYKTVTTWVTKKVAYERKVRLYKPCGTPYYAWKN